MNGTRFSIRLSLSLRRYWEAPMTATQQLNQRRDRVTRDCSRGRDKQRGIATGTGTTEAAVQRSETDSDRLRVREGQPRARCT